MIRDLRDALLSLGGATVLVALAGLALDNTLILNVGLKATGVTLLAYSAVALGVAGANGFMVIKTLIERVRK